MLQVKKQFSKIWAYLLAVALVFSVVPASVFAVEKAAIEDGVYTIETASWGIDSDTGELVPGYTNGKHQKKVELEVENGDITAYITANSKPTGGERDYSELTFYVSYGEITEANGYKRYAVKINDLTDLLQVAYGPNQRYVYYIEFLTDTITEENDDEEEDNGTGNGTSGDFAATHSISYELAATANATLVNPAEVQVKNDGVVVRLQISGRTFYFEKAADGFDSSPIAEEGELRTYELFFSSLDDLSAEVNVRFVAGGAASGYAETTLTFDLDTLTELDGEDDGGSNNQNFAATHTIAYDLAATANAALINPAQVQVKDNEVVVRLQINGRTFYFEKAADGFDSSPIEEEGELRTYELFLDSLDDLKNDINVRFVAGGAATGYAETTLSFDMTTLTELNNTGGDDDNDDDEGDQEFKATHTVEYALSTVPAGTTLENPAYLQQKAGGEVIVQLAMVGRACAFMNQGEYVTAVETVDSRQVFELLFDNITDLNEKIEGYFITSGSGSIETALTFDISTLKVIGSGSGDGEPPEETETDPQGDGGGKTGTVTFSIEAQAQNEDGTINEARDEFIDSDAKLKVSKGSIEAYVDISERELFTVAEDGTLENDVVETVDGVRTYRFTLNSPDDLDERIWMTFAISGDNPLYSGNNPGFYLAFIVNKETRAEIEDVFENGVDGDDDRTNPPGETDPTETETETKSGNGSGSGTTGSGSSSSGSSSVKTGDDAQTALMLFVLLSAASVAGFTLFLKKKKA